VEQSEKTANIYAALVQTDSLATNKQLLFISGLAHRHLHLLDLTMTRSFL